MRGRCLWLLIGSVGLLFWAPGCGVRAYEQRSQNTRRFFSRLDELNQVLQDSWTDGGGITLRLPRDFAELPPPPKPEKNPDDKEPVEAPVELPTVDPRQPQFLNVIFPGLRGVFRYGQEHSYIYILSSKDIRKPEGVDEVVLEQAGTDPARFNVDVCRIIADSFGLDLDYTKAEEQSYPTPAQPFFNTVKYRIVPVPRYTQTLQDGQTVDWVLKLYFFEGQDKVVQLAIVTIEPAATAGVATKAINSCLETLAVNEQAFHTAGSAIQALPGAGL